VFLINLPVGLLALAGVWVFIDEARAKSAKPFDVFGFGVLSLALVSGQMMFDRGPGQDWFASSEVWTYFILGGMGWFLFAMHTATARQPFFDRGLLADRNFLVSTTLGFFVGVLLFSSMALLPTMMETVLGYPVVTTGLVSMPRGIGSFVSMLVVGQLIGRVDVRAMVLTGLTLCAFAVFQMTHFSLQMDPSLIVWSGLVQGLGTSMIFVPLSTLAFATLRPSLRAEGAAVYTLMRSIGSSIGISLMQALHVQRMQAAQAQLSPHLTPEALNVAGRFGPPVDLSSTLGLGQAAAMVSRQAAMMAYVGDFQLLLIITLLSAPLLLLVRAPKSAKGEVNAVAE